MNNNSWADLSGKRILVTGASGGIGRACAVDCGKAGAAVVIMGRDSGRLNETLSLMGPGDHKAIEADLTVPEQWTARLSELIGSDGRFDGVIHAAGISTTLPFRMISPDKFRDYMEVNFVAAMELTRVVTKPANFSPDGGSVVFISSVMSMCGEAGKVLYSSTKGALTAAARSLAIELAPRQIRVNCISPGVVVTPMSQNAVYSKDEDSLNKIRVLHPLGLGNPTDVSALAVFLLSGAGRWITGTNIPVDGGYTAR